MEKILARRVKTLKNLKRIQCLKGNYDQSEYMRGLANGLIMALAVMQDKETKYKKQK